MLRFIWPMARSFAFWSIVALVAFGASYAFPFIDFRLIRDTISAATSGGIDGVSKAQFAYALAGTIGAIAAGLATAFLALHVAPICFALWQARRFVSGAKGASFGRSDARVSFAENFSRVRENLDRNWLLGQAWSEFEETLFDTDSDHAIGNTVRPQSFFNLGVAREHSTALKMMNAVPGYFVGIGLLLTFIGLVFALHKAGTAAAAGDAKQMASEMGQLLQIATFKFSTSIAGLSASILLSLIFRWYSILIERSFYRFNEALEGGLLYAAPQSISVEINRTLQDQLAQLKDITQGDFFARMGAEIERPLKAAISEAMQPVSDQIGNTVRNLGSTNEAGLKDMIEAFIRSLQSGAGTEMRELAATLKQLQISIAEMQGGLRGSGDDFSIKLSEAANGLSLIVERAGQTFEASSIQSQNALSKVVEDLRLTMERANSDMDKTLGSAANRAAVTLEKEVGIAVDSLNDPIRKISQHFIDLSSSMRSIEQAMLNQKAALEATSVEARKTADAFGESATSVRSATAPLVTVGDRFVGSTERLANSVETTLESLRVAKEQVSLIAVGLSAANDTTKNFWSSFTSKFDEVDTALARAVESLSQSTSNQQDLLQGHVQDVDRGLANALQKLSGSLTSLEASASSIADSMEIAKSRQSKDLVT